MGKQLGVFLRGQREKRGLSQGDVARQLSLKTAQSISNIERGISPLPRSKIKRLSEILGISKDEILGVVLREVQARYSKAAGVKARVVVVPPSVSSEEFDLISALTEKISGSKKAARDVLKKQIRKLVD